MLQLMAMLSLTQKGARVVCERTCVFVFPLGSFNIRKVLLTSLSLLRSAIASSNSAVLMSRSPHVIMPAGMCRGSLALAEVFV